MEGHIDWVSWTLATPREPVDGMDLYLLARELIKKVGIEHERYIYDGTGFDQTTGRTPYRIGLQRDDHGVRCYGDSPTQTVLYELAGRACEGLRGHHDGQLFLGPLQSDLTRLDYAVDIDTVTRPAEFANSRSHKAFRTISFIRSDTGETAYIGSAKSDRFCRVYRYNQPHPRSHLLRVEFVFRRKLAQAAAGELCQSENAATFITKLGNTFGFSHRDWQPGWETDERIAAPQTTQKQEDTVMWLYKQVAPAVRRLLAEGALDMTQWLEHIYAE